MMDPPQGAAAGRRQQLALGQLLRKELSRSVQPSPTIWSIELFARRRRHPCRRPRRRAVWWRSAIRTARGVAAAAARPADGGDGGDICGGICGASVEASAEVVAEAFVAARVAAVTSSTMTAPSARSRVVSTRARVMR